MCDEKCEKDIFMGKGKRNLVSKFLLWRQVSYCVKNVLDIGVMLIAGRKRKYPCSLYVGGVSLTGLSRLLPPNEIRVRDQLTPRT